MKKYELSSLVSSQLADEAAKAFLEKVSSLITAEGGEFVESKSPTRKRLGYPIKHERQAWFSVINFEMEPEKLEGLKNQLKDLPEILRFMVVNQKPVSEAMETIDELIKEPGIKTETEPTQKIIEELPTKQTKEEKVELEDIDKKLQEILGEN
jgi:small subunit ribosomal protein S6